jgi:hypothetical protein
MTRRKAGEASAGLIGREFEDRTQLPSMSSASALNKRSAEVARWKLKDR